MRNKPVLLILPALLLSQAVSGAGVKEKAFVKGNISEKIALMQGLDESERVPIARRGLDFLIENAAVLGSDEEFRSLALASVSALPADGGALRNVMGKERVIICEKLMTVFRIFDDMRIRAAVMERLQLYSDSGDDMLTSFINDYLAVSYKAGEPAENVLESAIVAAGKIGDDDTLSVIYNIWHSGIWPQYQDSTDEALVRLSAGSFSDTIRIFSVSNISEFGRYFALLKKNLRNSRNSLCDVAENALLIAINNVEKLAASDEEKKVFVAFQSDAHEVLAGNRWSHAANVVSDNILLAEKFHGQGFLDDEAFARMIEVSVNVPSHGLAQNLTDMLAACNGKVENSEMPARSVVLALIHSLGELGDKTAFDTLLYVTYLSYPAEVLDEAKLSLAKLNW